MSGTLNKAMILGHLGGDPDVRTMQQSGDKIANLSIATSERWKDRDGNRQERTEWHRVSIFGNTAEVAEKYLKKGSRVLIEGQLQTRKWQDRDGQDRYTTEIVVRPYSGKLTLLDSKERQGDGDRDRSAGRGGYGGDQGGRSDGGGQRGQYGDAPDYSADLDDEIPF